jgi:RNA polymerase sigma factor (sigma-70 family)
MAASSMNEVIQHFRRTARWREAAGLTDGRLLGCFIDHRDEGAFAALVGRHGSMVWGVCRRLLGQHDAEDAFQATFLVLVRKAASIMPRDRLANWLYGVAHQTALEARRTVARRRTKEKSVTEMPQPAVREQDLWRELRPVLDQELSRLPHAYREVLVLADLEGMTRKEVARQLGLPEGTVGSRLARGRTLLAKRLARHQLAVSAAALAAVASAQAAATAPASLVSNTIRAARLAAKGEAAAAGAFSARVAALTEGVLKTMLLSKLKTALAVMLVLGILATGVLVLISRTAGANGQPSAAGTLARDSKPDQPPAAAGKTAKSNQDHPDPKADKQREKALEALAKPYALKASEVLKCFPRPFPPEREAYVDTFYPQLPNAGRELDGYTWIMFTWSDRLKYKAASHHSNPRGLGRRLLDVMTGLLDCPEREIEGDETLRTTAIAADFVVREAAPPQKIVDTLAGILKDQFNLKVKLTIKEEEREVFVLKGKYKSHAGAKPLEIYGHELTDPEIGTRSGTFRDMVGSVGDWIKWRIVTEVEDAPKQVTWHVNCRPPYTKETLAHDQNPESVLKHLCEQTGLTVGQEKRRVRVVAIEPVGP